MKWFKRKPVQSTLLVAVSIAILLTISLWYGLSRSWMPWPWLLSWLAAVNATTFGAYGIDKFQARNAGWRIPEKSLLTLGFLGGAIGAWTGMRLFRHKTIKAEFRFVFWLLLALQLTIAAIVAWQIWI